MNINRHGFVGGTWEGWLSAWNRRRVVGVGALMLGGVCLLWLGREALAAADPAKVPQGQTIYVDASNQGVEDGTSEHPYNTITEAVTNVLPDNFDTVIVRPGEYEESFLVPRACTLQGEQGAYHTRITKNDASKLAFDAAIALGNNAVLCGITVRNLSAAQASYAVYTLPAAKAKVTNCVITASKIGLQVAPNATVNFANNTVVGNDTGVHAAPGATFSAFENSIFMQNTLAVRADSGHFVGNTYNLFYLNTQCFQFANGTLTDFEGDPAFVDAAGLNFHLTRDSIARDAGDPALAFNDLDGSRNDIGADGGPGGVQDLTAPVPCITTTPDPPAGFAPLLVSFSGADSTDEWGIASYEWDFNYAKGAKFDAQGVSVDHTYTAEGSYQARLTVTDNSGNSASTTVEVVAGAQNPVITCASADPMAGPAPLEIQFSADAEDPDGGTVTYSWDFDGDALEDSAEQNPLYTYPEGSEPGRHTALLTVTDDETATATATVEITITAGTVEQAAFVEATAGGTVVVNTPGSPLEGAEVDIPAGALSENAVISIGEPPVEPPPSTGEVIVVGLELGPSGTVFSEPVTIRIPFSPPPKDGQAIHVLYYNAGTGEWSDAGITDVQYADGYVTFKTTHFTVFSVQAMKGDVDLNNDIDALDVQLVINAALGLSIAPYSGDIDQSGSVDAIDVQLAINGALDIPIK